MFKIAKSLFLQHSSLLVIVASALGFFLSNIIMKEILPSAESYGYYSIFVTYFSILYVLGILGFEQVFLRYSHPKKGRVLETQRSQMYIVTLLCFFSASIATYLFKSYYPYFSISNWLLYLSTFCMISQLFLFNILRLNSMFFLSQIAANFWKLLLCSLAIFYWFFDYNNLQSIIEILCYSAIFIWIVNIFYIIKNVQFQFNKDLSTRELLLALFHFFIAIVGFCLVTFSDRFLVEEKFDIEVFGDYFYLSNFFLAPFSILQNYIGFKHLIAFKANFSRELFISFNKKVLYFSLLFSAFLLIVCWVISSGKILSFKFDEYWPLVFLLLLLGVIRLYSSGIVSAFEARTNLQSLRVSNFLILSFTVVVLGLLYYFANAIDQIIIGIIIIWIFRCFVHRQLLLSQVKEKI